MAEAAKKAGLNKHQFTPTIVHFTVYTPNGKAYHTGKFNLHLDQERIAFGIRCNDALMAGHTIVTSGHPLT